MSGCSVPVPRHTQPCLHRPMDPSLTIRFSLNPRLHTLPSLPPSLGRSPLSRERVRPSLTPLAASARSSASHASSEQHMGSPLRRILIYVLPLRPSHLEGASHLPTPPTVLDLHCRDCRWALTGECPRCHIDRIATPRSAPSTKTLLAEM